MFKQEWLKGFFARQESWVESDRVLCDADECEAAAAELADTAKHREAMLRFVDRCLTRGEYSVKASLRKHAAKRSRLQSDKLQIAADNLSVALLCEIKGQRMPLACWQKVKADYAKAYLDNDGVIKQAHATIAMATIPHYERARIDENYLTLSFAVPEVERKMHKEFSTLAWRVAEATIKTARMQAELAAKIASFSDMLAQSQSRQDVAIAGAGAAVAALDEIRRHLIAALQESQLPD